jgi:hypothetical protein
MRSIGAAENKIVSARRRKPGRRGDRSQNSLPRLARAGPQFRIELGFCALHQKIDVRI